MNILAFDTSGQTFTVAFWDGKTVPRQSISKPGVRHSDALMPAIETLLKKVHRPLSTLDAIAVGIGPGSFTGLRIAVATAKILGYVHSIPLVGVSGLEAMAFGALADKEGQVAVRMDARRGQFYAAIYENVKGRRRAIVTPTLMDQAHFESRTTGLSVVDPQEHPPEARFIAQAAFSKILKKKFTDPFELEALYLRPRDCNVTIAKKK